MYSSSQPPSYKLQQMLKKNAWLLTIYAVVLSLFVFKIITWPSGSAALISEYGVFFLLGLVGALVANSTGAGGGVIFIPFFASLGFSPLEAVGTSIAIQCFGMTAGSVSWLRTLKATSDNISVEKHVILQIMLLGAVCTVIGMLAGQFLIPEPALSINIIFRIFSVFFGGVLLFFTFYKGITAKELIHSLRTFEVVLISVTCLVGGVITAWISVGVGEMIALLLFFLGFPAAIAVAVGVCMSAVAVLTGVQYHLWITDSISPEVVIFAGAAAFIGGYIAKYITRALGSYYLKIFFGLWILITGLIM